MYFTIDPATGGYRAYLWSNNNQIVWWTETYVNKASAENAIRIAKASQNAPVYDRMLKRAV